MNTQSSYDLVADEYATRIYNELKDKPLDRLLLDRFAASLAVSPGRVCDLGCGPGQIARYLKDRGADVFGVDFSAGMLAQARRLNPDIDFVQGNMRALDLPNESLAGIAAFYSIIHIEREGVTSVLRELRRALQPNGLLLFSFHIGDDVKHLEEWWGKAVSADFFQFQAEEMRGYLREAGFQIEETLVRWPYEGTEYQSQRAYIFARKPVA
jgi:SAM-dependent methyltransferase